MSAENTITGINAKFVVDDALVARTTSWTVSPKLATSNEWGDSDSGGYTNRSRGRKDCTVAVEGKFDTSDEVYDLFQEGDVVAGVCWLDNSSLYYDFPRLLCIDFTLVTNTDTEEVIGWTANFGSDGVYYRPGEDGATSRTLPS